MRNAPRNDLSFWLRKLGFAVTCRVMDVEAHLNVFSGGAKIGEVDMSSHTCEFGAS